MRMSLSVSVVFFNLLLVELLMQNYLHMSHSYIRCIIFLVLERLLRLIICPQTNETANLQYNIENSPPYGHFWTSAFNSTVEDVNASESGLIVSTYSLPPHYLSVRIVTICYRGTNTVVNLVPGAIHIRLFLEFKMNFEQLIYFPELVNRKGWEVAFAKPFCQKSDVLVAFRPKSIQSSTVDDGKLYFFVLNLQKRRWHQIKLKSSVTIEHPTIFGVSVQLTASNSAAISLWNPIKGQVTVLTGSELFRKEIKKAKFRIAGQTAKYCDPMIRSSIFTFDMKHICLVPIRTRAANEYHFNECFVVGGSLQEQKIELLPDLLLNCRPKYDHSKSVYHLFQDSLSIYCLISPRGHVFPIHQLCLWRLNISDFRWNHIKDLSAPGTTVFPVLACSITSEGLLIIETTESTMMEWIRVPKLELLALRSLQTVKNHVDTLLGNDFPKLIGFQNPYDPRFLASLF